MFGLLEQPVAKPSKKVAGIYCFIHRPTLKCYVGSSVHVHGRHRGHFKSARKGSNDHFHKCIRELGEESFDFEVIEVLNGCTRAFLLEREKFWIQFYDAASVDGFNSVADPTKGWDYAFSDVTKERLAAAARGKAYHKGFKHSDEAKKKMSDAKKGRKLSNEHKAKIGAAGIGRKPTEETLSKLSKALKGRIITPEWRAKLAAAQTGKTHTEETRKKMAGRMRGNKIMLGRKHTEETKAKISAGNIGREVSEETRERIAAPQRGRKFSEEHIKNISISQKARFQRESPWNKGLTLTK